MKIIHKKIADFADVVTGGTPSTTKPEYWNGNIPWLNSGILNDGDIYRPSKFITELGLKNSAAKVMPMNTVLIALTGATTGQVGYLQIEASANQSVTGILPSKEHHPRYLYYYLRTKKKKIQGDAFGGGQPHINQQYVKDFTIPLPPLDDQIRIATILTRAERLIATRKESIKALNELLKSTFLDMFGKFVISKNYKLFGDFIDVLTDYHANGSYEILRKNVELLNTPDYALMVRTTDLENNNFENECIYITKDAYEFLSKSKVFGGEIIINKIGSAGRVYLMPHLNRPVSLGMNAFLIRLRTGLNNIYIYYLLTSEFGTASIQKHVKGAVTKTITKEAIRGIKIPVPPIELQNQFAAIVEKVESIKAKQAQSLAELENLYASLSQRAFKGELDLSKVPVETPPKNKVTITIEEPEIIDTKSREMKFSEEALIYILNEQKGNKLSITDIWDLIENSAFEPLSDGNYFERLPDKKELQTMIIKDLESSNPKLEQVFDILDSDKNKNEPEKQIVLRVKNDS